jgi:hypothetical protein
MRCAPARASGRTASASSRFSRLTRAGKRAVSRRWDEAQARDEVGWTERPRSETHRFSCRPPVVGLAKAAQPTQLSLLPRLETGIHDAETAFPTCEFQGRPMCIAVPAGVVHVHLSGRLGIAHLGIGQIASREGGLCSAYELRQRSHHFGRCSPMSFASYSLAALAKFSIAFQNAPIPSR